MYPNEKNKPQISAEPSLREVALALAQWLHKDEFVLYGASRGGIARVAGAPVGCGWDFRVKQFAYSRAKPLPAFESVRADIAPICQAFAETVGHYDWRKIESEADISKNDLAQIADLAKRTIVWGGLMPRNYDFSEAWKVVKTAASNCDNCGAPMNSGWTKVAALATNGMRNEQNIYDSRCSFSVIHRLDIMGLGPENLQKCGLSGLTLVASGRGGTRKEGPFMRKFNLWKPCTNSAAGWGAHFACAKLVREIVAVLNDPKNAYPKMPLPQNRQSKWDVLGVGMVLFMDGY